AVCCGRRRRRPGDGQMAGARGGERGREPAVLEQFRDRRELPAELQHLLEGGADRGRRGLGRRGSAAASAAHGAAGAAAGAAAAGTTTSPAATAAGEDGPGREYVGV